MAAVYEDEEEVWKCAKHPPRPRSSRRPRYGICHLCLKERLAALCPHCGCVRPCSCALSAADSSSSSSSTTIKRSGSVSRISSLFEISSSSRSSSTNDPSLRRSRSLAIPFLRSSNNRHADADAASKTAPTPAPSFWSILKGPRKLDVGDREVKSKKEKEKEKGEEDEQRQRRMMMRKSRSVAVTSSSGKGSGWHFPSPMKIFRLSKISSRGGLEIERSPLDRG